MFPSHSISWNTDFPSSLKSHENIQFLVLGEEFLHPLKPIRMLGQATHMSADVVSEEAVYQCTGNPLPKDIEAIVQALFNEDFVDVFAKVQDMQINKGLALTDIVQQLHPCAPASPAAI